MGIALLFILVFHFDDSGFGLFEILWIFYPRPSSFNAQYLISDTHCWCSTFYTRYISLSILDSIFPSRALMHPIVYQNWSFQDVHPSSPVAIGLPTFGLCYLAIIMAIQWKSWRLITKRKSRLHLIGFSISPPIMALKGGKPHALTSRWSADRLDNLSCVRISEWEYIFQVTYVIVVTTSFHLNRWRCQCGRAELCSKKVNIKVNIRTCHVICYVTSILNVTILHQMRKIIVYYY